MTLRPKRVERALQQTVLGQRPAEPEEYGFSAPPYPRVLTPVTRVTDETPSVIYHWANTDPNFPYTVFGVYNHPPITGSVSYGVVIDVDAAVGDNLGYLFMKLFFWDFESSVWVMDSLGQFVTNNQDESQIIVYPITKQRDMEYGLMGVWLCVAVESAAIAIEDISVYGIEGSSFLGSQHWFGEFKVPGWTDGLIPVPNFSTVNPTDITTTTDIPLVVIREN